MKSSFLRYIIVVSVLLVCGCSKESVLLEPLVNRVDTTIAVIKVKGDFSNGPYGSVSGQATVYMDSTRLVVALENFSSASGPDLKVYLSRELDPVNFINLGSLRSTNGNQTYPCPLGTTIGEYKYVLIYCQQYKHLFGAAPL